MTLAGISRTYGSTPLVDKSVRWRLFRMRHLSFASDASCCWSLFQAFTSCANLRMTCLDHSLLIRRHARDKRVLVRGMWLSREK